jgi:cobalt-precorrin-7 (C5)-methyltransferase
MKVIGVGCGPGLLTEEAIGALKEAVLVFGSERAIELARKYISPGCRTEVLKEYRDLGRLPRDSVLLSTGDPMLEGLGRYGDEVIPGISSLQLAACRLRIPLTRLNAVSAHGREIELAREDVLRILGKEDVACLLTAPSFDICVFCESLAGSFPGTMVALCEELGYPGERIARGTVECPPEVRSPLFIVVIGKFGGK